MYRRKGTYRQYSEEEKALALSMLKASQGNLHEAGRLTDIPPATIRRWSLGDGYHPSVQMTLEERQKLIADRLETVIHRLLDIVPDKENEATLQQTMTSVAIAIDKMRLMREQPTQITQRETAINASELLERLRNALPNSQPDATGTMASGNSAGPLQLPGPAATNQST